MRFAEAGIGAHGVHATSDDYRGIEAASCQNRGDHRRGRGLAMHAGDGDAILQPHQLGQHLGALNHGDVLLVGGDDFGVVGREPPS